MPKKKDAHLNGKVPELITTSSPESIAEDLKQQGFPEDEAEKIAKLSYERRKPNSEAV